jgi:hypothetical protein
VKGHFYEKNRHPEPYIRVVTDGYFEAAGIPLRAGRLLAEGDRAASTPVAVVNETMARTAFPSENPLGQTITTHRGERVLGVVVGVVADVRHSALEEASGPEMYLAMRQTGDYAAMQLVVRTALPPDSLAEGIRTALRPIDPNLPVRDFQTFQALVDKAISPRRALLLLLGGFAVFALFLASFLGDLCRDLLFGQSKSAGDWNSNGLGGILRRPPKPYRAPNAKFGWFRSGFRIGRLAGTLKSLGKFVVRGDGRRSGDIRRNCTGAHRCPGSGRVHSRLEGIPYRSHDCLTIKLIWQPLMRACT